MARLGGEGPLAQGGKRGHNSEDKKNPPSRLHTCFTRDTMPQCRIGLTCHVRCHMHSKGASSSAAIAADIAPGRLFGTIGARSPSSAASSGVKG